MWHEAFRTWFRLFPSLLVMALVVLGLSACGSTRVVMAQKTIVHQDVVYNVSNVDQLRPARVLILPDGSTLDPQRLDDRARRDLFKQHDSVQVRLNVMLDETALPYINSRVSSASELRRAEREFDRELERIQKFLADRKQTQLKLK